MNNGSRSHRLIHPGSKSVPPARPKILSDISGSGVRWSGPLERNADSRDGAADSTERSEFEHLRNESTTNVGRWVHARSIFHVDHDQPTPPGINDAVDFSTVFGTIGYKHREPLPFDIGKPTDGAPRQKGKKQKHRVPEQKITLFAFRLAMIEKAASNVGTMAFLWATVVILGGFATTITFDHFWVVTVIIVAEAARIFNRSHELEWQNVSSKLSGSGAFSSALKSASDRLHLTSASSRAVKHETPNIETKTKPIDIYADVHPKRRIIGRAPGRAGFEERIQERQDEFGVGAHKMERTWSKSSIPILPYTSFLFTTQSVSRILYVAQIISALVCIGLSLWGLAKQEYCTSECPGHSTLDNVGISMTVFYALATIEAALFLLEKGYFEYKIRFGNLLRNVRIEVRQGLGESYDRVISSFYYAVYHRCLEGSVFDGLDMDLVKFGIQWLESEYFQQQLSGAKLLNQLVSGDPRENIMVSDALRRLGTTTGVIERLVEMLSWNSQEEGALLFEVVSIVSSLVAYERNCSRIVAVPGALDAIVSLLILYPTSCSELENVSEAAAKRLQIVCLTSLQILKYLSRAFKNSQKIGDTKGLLAVLVIFIQVSRTTSAMPKDDINWKIRKKSLQILYLLVAGARASGEAVRQKVARIVSGLKNLRDIIDMCDERPELQLLSMKILLHMALEDDVRSSIGAASGTIQLLFRIFQQNDSVRDALKESTGQDASDHKFKLDRMAAVETAGELLTRLTVQNKKNCLRLLKLKCIEGTKSLPEVLVASLSLPDKIATSAAEILRNILPFADETTRQYTSIASAPILMANILADQGNSKSLLYQVSLGLTSRTIELLPLSRYRQAFGAGDFLNFVGQLFRNLKHTPTTNKYPRIRRYSVELVLASIARENDFLKWFDELDLDVMRALEEALETISEVENFILFSDLVGYARHGEDIEDLLIRCIQAVERYRSENRSVASP